MGVYDVGARSCTGFLARVFEAFRDQKLSVDVVATSEVRSTQTRTHTHTHTHTHTRTHTPTHTRTHTHSHTLSWLPRRASIVSYVQRRRRAFFCAVFFVCVQVSVSITLDPKKVSDLSQQLDALEKELRKYATVSHRQNLAIVSLICNVKRTSSILEKVGWIHTSSHTALLAAASLHSGAVLRAEEELVRRRRPPCYMMQVCVRVCECV
jgi:aspartokinase